MDTTTLAQLLRRGRRFLNVREEGQALVIFVMGFAVLAAAVGLSVDVGQIVLTRTDLQKTSDAAALAGAQDLPLTAVAELMAQQYVTENGGSNTSGDVEFSYTYAGNDTITVTSTRHVSYTFLRFVGLSGTDVSATATVTVGNYAGGTGVLPWGFIADPGDPTNHLLGNACFDGFGSDGLPDFKTDIKCILKYGAGESGGGDFGSLALDNTGADTYRDNIKYGSNTPIKKGDVLEPQTGNLAGPTIQGVGDRMALVSNSCDEKGELVTADGFGGYYINDECADSPNLIVIPVVNQIKNPELSTVLGFAFMWLQGSTNKGGHQSIVGEFLTFVEELPNGVYEGFGDGPKSIKLVE
jgi:Flp pilus assembly protein TadG